jgi:hypothetical protein
MKFNSDITPLPPEAIDYWDSSFAKFLLLRELWQIPEFMTLLRRVRYEAAPKIGRVMQSLEEQFVNTP